MKTVYNKQSSKEMLLGARHGVGANNAMVKHTQTVVFGEAVISVTRFKDIRCHTVLVSFVMRKNKFETLF